MRIYVSGPSLGPVHTTAWSSGTRGHRYHCRGPWWPRRFTTLRYWLLGVWEFELLFWAAYGAVWAVREITEMWKKRGTS
jgi:hypothetical protein